MKKFLFKLLATCFLALPVFAQNSQVGGALVVPSTSGSLLGATNVVMTDADCVLLTPGSACTVSGGSLAAYVKTLNVTGTLTAPRKLTVVVSPGREYAVTNSTSQALTVGGATGTAVVIPAPVAPATSTTATINSPDGANYLSDNVLPITLVGSATTSFVNNVLQADSQVGSAAYGYIPCGDSITYAAGSTAPQYGYTNRIAADMGFPANYNTSNCARSGDTAADATYLLFQNVNPGDTGNPVTSLMIGTNDATQLTGIDTVTYQRHLAASLTWAGLSSSNKIMAANSAVTQTGTWTADTTFANAPGLTCATACTLTYAATVGRPGVFYTWAKSLLNSGGTYTVSVDGTVVADTITGLTAVPTSSSRFNNYTVGVTSGRFAATNGTHTLVITVAAGPVTFFGFGFTPTTRNRGVTGPRIIQAGVPPEQHNAQASLIATYNTASVAMNKTLVGDGLNIPFVDVNVNLDPELDFASTATQNCPASTAPGLHPNNCGHLHLAQLFEAAIGFTTPLVNLNVQTVAASSYIAAPLATFGAAGAQGRVDIVSSDGTAFLMQGTSDGNTNIQNGTAGVYLTGNPYNFSAQVNSTGGGTLGSYAHPMSLNVPFLSGPQVTSSTMACPSAVGSEWTAQDPATSTIYHYYCAGTSTIVRIPYATYTSTGSVLPGEVTYLSTSSAATDSIVSFYNGSNTSGQNIGAQFGIGAGTANNLGMYFINSGGLGSTLNHWWMGLASATSTGLAICSNGGIAVGWGLTTPCPTGTIFNVGGNMTVDAAGNVTGANITGQALTGVSLTVTTPTGSVVAGVSQTGQYTETLYTPASSSAACTVGQFGDDTDYHYVCVATNTWKRVALSTF